MTEDYPPANHGGKVWQLSRKNKVPVSEILDFSANINDFVTETDFHAIFQLENIANYPDTDLDYYTGIISDYTGTPLRNIMLGPGLTYFIYRLAEMFRNTNILIFEPSFTEYKRAFQLNNCTVDECRIEELSVRLNDIASGKYQFVVLTRPDNPLGNAIKRDLINSLARKADSSGTKVFIDEAFLDFMGRQEIQLSASLVMKYRNVILGRSLTKFLSIPALRLGYIVSNTEFIGSLKSKLEPWSINQPALMFLSNVDFQKTSATIPMVVEERKFLVTNLGNYGFMAVGNPRANFVTFKLPDGVISEELDRYLQSNNILVRFLDDHPWLGSRYVRIAVKRRNKTVKLLNCLEDYFSSCFNNISDGV